MLHKKWIGIALIATAAVSTTAFADNRGINTALGAVVGAVIGNSVGGQNGAIVGGVLGAAVGASASGHGDRYYGRQPQAYYQAPPNYYRPAPAYARPYYRDSYAQRDDYRNQSYRDVRRVDYEPYGRGDYRR
ncbi:MAG: YMGG-like glycine zipper-containing protein [Pseudomonadota bacterium]|uniref:YMGG-like glycine zipper-containing protein n=1 Tax=Herminiimonas arsenitoxidans TaxID=1809410 RepID=UPI0009710F63|nr:YMGG-like glycine zipper-containing protein [Herminiimonas arsenitoxidans]